MANGDSNNTRAGTMKAGGAAEDSSLPPPTFPRSMKRYFSSFTRPKSTSSSRRASQLSDSGFSTLSSSSAPPTYEDTQAATARLIAVWDADDYIRAFVDEHWSNHAEHIEVDCNITLDELRTLGRLPPAEGSRACRPLIRAPVIHEEVALSLWEHLAAEARGLDAAPAEASNREEASSMPTTSIHSKSSRREVAKRFLKKGTTKKSSRRQPQAQESNTYANLTCPFCSGRCLVSSAAQAAHTLTQPPPHQQEEDWEEGFWQREEPPRYRRYAHFSEPPAQEHMRHSRPSAGSGGAARPSNTPEAENGGSRKKREWLKKKTGRVSEPFRLVALVIPQPYVFIGAS
ncbi:hypothetical protein N657DRAFT_687584 [Parathielavia appendiculata]|uniref:Uncharacterized protein n=1 Tax=Parathielavia appendiculata TaxID=2587402 RepID=A0AAN6U934_9PEZI|nr:hypothetical protein N657DRAFT_687584 [Parathielavia appendiculata]